MAGSGSFWLKKGRYGAALHNDFKTGVSYLYSSEDVESGRTKVRNSVGGTESVDA